MARRYSLRTPVPAWATESFRTGREAHLQRLEIALALYALGFIVEGALAAVAARILPLWAELLAWMLTASTALVISDFMKPRISARTDATFVFIMIRLPMIIAGISGLAALLSLSTMFIRRSAPTALEP